MRDEVWKPIDVAGFEGLYEVSNLGRVRSKSRVIVTCEGKTYPMAGRVLRFGSCGGNKKYLNVVLANNGARASVAVNRLVAVAFHGPPPSEAHQAAHNNNDPSDNSALNIRWATPKENNADKIVHGTQQRGERHGCAKLSTREVASIQNDSRPQRVIARAYAISKTQVGRIKRGESWVEVPR